MKKNKLPPLDFLHKILYYDENSISCLRWKDDRNYNVEIGEIAGTKHHAGYWITKINEVKYYNHLLVFYMVSGKELDYELEIDHIDRDRGNNKFENLRQISKSHNLINSTLYRNNSSGYVGVNWSKLTERWVARIYINQKRKTLGTFKYINDAIYIRIKTMVETYDKTLVSREISAAPIDVINKLIENKII